MVPRNANIATLIPQFTCQPAETRRNHAQPNPGSKRPCVHRSEPLTMLPLKKWQEKDQPLLVGNQSDQKMAANQKLHCTTSLVASLNVGEIKMSIKTTNRWLDLVSIGILTSIDIHYIRQRLVTRSQAVRNTAAGKVSISKLRSSKLMTLLASQTAPLLAG